jgi:hypothetical protein
MNARPKTIIYRNRRLLDLAHKVNECKFNLPPCIGYSVEGCEPAHSNHYEHGHGKGIKASDDQHAAGCRPCHKYYDAHLLPREQELQIFNAARKRTFDHYEKMGWLAKVGYVQEEPAKVEW